MKRVVWCLCAFACGAPPPVAAEAEHEIPTFLALHTTVIARSCSPNPGVCHQTNNYPDLTTPGSVLSMIGMPCNLEIPDPTQGWDGCEQKADQLEVYDAGEEDEPRFSSAIAWKEKLGVGRWKLGLKKAATETLTSVPQISASEVLLYADAELGVTIELIAGSAEAIVSAPLGSDEVEGYAIDLDSILAVVAVGDANKNGIFGFEAADVEHGSLIHPGSISKSYLFGRITGTVPGTRMPLANQPLSEAEYLAVACWIEQLSENRAPAVTDAIDYQRCGVTSSRSW